MAEKNTYLTLELEDGNSVELTLNFYRLYQLKTKKPEEYAKYFKITEKGLKDEFDVWSQIYCGYLCANIEVEELAYPTFESFLMVVPDSRVDMWKTYNDLLGRKKKKQES